MSRLTDFLKLHIWQIPGDNNEQFDYKKSIGDNFEKIDKGLKDAIDKFTEPLSYKGEVLTKQNLPTQAQNGDIYNVTSENKNYIYNGTNWVPYSSTLNLEYLENNTKTTKATQVSTGLTIQDSANVNAKLDIKNGKTEQETSTTGKNKFQIGERTENTVGVTSTVDLSEITLNGTTTVNGNLTVGHKSELSGYDYIGRFEAGTYYFSKFILGGSWTQNEEGSTFAYYLRDVNRTALCSIGGLTESGTNKKIVLEEETDLYIQIYCNGANTIFNNYKLGFQLEKDNATPYEKYIKTMPSTLFPSRIRNVGDNINIFDEELETGAISTTTGELTTNSQRRRSKNFIKVKNDTNYIMTVDNELISLNRMFYDKDYNFISSTTNSSFRRPSTARYMKFYGTSDLANAKIKIQEGTIATPYTPYNCGSVDFKVENEDKSQSKIVHFPFAQGQVLHENDYLAQDGIHQKRTTLLLDGTQNINSINTTLDNTVRVLIDISNKLAVTGDNTVDFKCSHLPNRIVWNADKEGAYSATNAIVLRFNKDIVGTTKTQINAYLAEQYANGTPVTIEYKLAEEIIVPYTSAQQESYYQLQHLLMYEGYNKIICIDEVKPDMQLTYYYNNEINNKYAKRIDYLEEKIRQLEQAISSQSEVSE